MQGVMTTTELLIMQVLSVCFLLCYEWFHSHRQFVQPSEQANWLATAAMVATAGLCAPSLR
jgi:uncharacterized membrane protein